MFQSKMTALEKMVELKIEELKSEHRSVENNLRVRIQQFERENKKVDQGLKRINLKVRMSYFRS